jgi:hypothetical protein
LQVSVSRPLYQGFEVSPTFCYSAVAIVSSRRSSAGRFDATLADGCVVRSAPWTCKHRITIPSVSRSMMLTIRAALQDQDASPSCSSRPAHRAFYLVFVLYILVLLSCASACVCTCAISLLFGLFVLATALRNQFGACPFRLPFSTPFSLGFRPVGFGNRQILDCTPLPCLPLFSQCNTGQNTKSKSRKKGEKSSLVCGMRCIQT